MPSDLNPQRLRLIKLLRKAKARIWKRVAEELEKPKGLKRKLYKLTFKGILVALNELQEEDDIEKLVNKNSTELYFDITNKFLAIGLKDDAYFYIDSLKESVSRGFVNAELMDEGDVKLAASMFLFKQIGERLDYFKKKAEMTENESLRKYYLLMQKLGSWYKMAFEENLPEKLPAIWESVKKLFARESQQA